MIIEAEWTDQQEIKRLREREQQLLIEIRLTIGERERAYADCVTLREELKEWQQSNMKWFLEAKKAHADAMRLVGENLAAGIVMEQMNNTIDGLKKSLKLNQACPGQGRVGTGGVSL